MSAVAQRPTCVVTVTYTLTPEQAKSMRKWLGAQTGASVYTVRLPQVTS